MKFDKTKDKAVATRDAECYRKFLAGNKTLYTQAFWEKAPLDRVNGSGDEREATQYSKAEDTRN